jgi:hypothetical protein
VVGVVTLDRLATSMVEDEPIEVACREDAISVGAT